MKNQGCEWIYYGAGMVYKKYQLYELATNAFNRVVELNPSYGNAYAQLGLIRKNEGRKEEAEAFFEKAMDCEPENEIANYQSGLWKVQIGSLDDAAAFFTKVIKINPFRIDAQIDLGFVHGRKGDFDAAEKLINDAYCKDQKQKDGFARLGWIKAENKDWLGALELADRDRVLERLSPVWQINLAQIYGRVGNFGRAMGLIEKAYSQRKDLKDGYARLGLIKAEAEDWQRGIELMELDFKVDRMTSAKQIDLAQLFGRLGDFDRASDLIEQAYSRSESLKDGYARLGWIKTAIQDWHGAFGLMVKDHEKEKLSPLWQTLLAVINVFRCEYDGAVRLIEDLYSLDKNAVDGYAKLGWAHYLSSGSEQSLQFFVEKDAGLNRLSAEGNKIKSIAMSMRGELSSALSLMDSLYSENSAMENGFAAIGWYLIEKGEVKLGLTLMDKDYQLHRLSHAWSTNYAYQLARAGQTHKARVVFNEVMDTEPNLQEFSIGYQLIPSKKMSKRDIEQMMKPAL